MKLTSIALVLGLGMAPFFSVTAALQTEQSQQGNTASVSTTLQALEEAQSKKMRRNGADHRGMAALSAVEQRASGDFIAGVRSGSPRWVSKRGARRSGVTTPTCPSNRTFSGLRLSWHSSVK